jgi:hypothetical protein
MEKPVKSKWPGIIPWTKSVTKSFLFGNDTFYDGDQTYVNATDNRQFLQYILSETHVFDRMALRHLVETGYSNNPACFGIINKILLAQRNINFIPYWAGKPYKKHTYDLDTNLALQMLLLTGTCIIYKKEIVGFPSERIVLNTLNVEEIYQGGKFVYRYWNDDGSWLMLDNSSMIFIKFFDVARKNTQMGLSPLQAALMPIESLRQMYVADTSTLKNKGVDVLITNDSDNPIVADEQGDMDQALNKRLSGARKSGGVATSTSKLRVLQLGRSTKELALWDGYKIKIRDLCNVLQVDSGQFNDPDNKKFANVQESNKALYNDCVIPFTRLITENQQLKDDLGFDIYLDTSGIDCLQEAQSVRAEKAQTITNAIVNLNSQVRSGVITPEIAIKIMVSEWGFEQEEASQFIVGQTMPDQNQGY